MHKVFLDWILSQNEHWKFNGIIIDEIVDKINNPAITGFPFVSVHHTSKYAMGQISLHTVRNGYIVDFEAVKIETEEPCFYHYEFSANPLFDLWQERYVNFLCSI